MILRISLDELRHIPKNKILVFDLEHTAVENPELLEFSAVWADGSLAMNSYVRPLHAKEWPHAMEVNHITPAMVAQAPTIDVVGPRIEALMQEAMAIVGYSYWNDFFVLEKNGVTIPEKTVLPRVDVSIPFSVVYRKHVVDEGNYNQRKLSICAKYYGFTSENWHDSMTDAVATAFCFNRMLSNGDIVLTVPKKKKKKPPVAPIPACPGKGKHHVRTKEQSHRLTIKRRERRKRAKARMRMAKGMRK